MKLNRMEIPAFTIQYVPHENYGEFETGQWIGVTEEDVTNMVLANMGQNQAFLDYVNRVAETNFTQESESSEVLQAGLKIVSDGFANSDFFPNTEDDGSFWCGFMLNGHMVHSCAAYPLEVQGAHSITPKIGRFEGFEGKMRIKLEEGYGAGNL